MPDTNEKLIQYLADKLVNGTVGFKNDGTVSDRDNCYIRQLVADFCARNDCEMWDYAVHFDFAVRELTLISEFTEETYTRVFKIAPFVGDLDRVNCHLAGHVGHQNCGVCGNHNRPRFECGCIKHLNPWER